ncbi:MAG TPA: hypothetical protein VF473_00335 [Cyclobacteriaceae bacterium]
MTRILIVLFLLIAGCTQAQQMVVMKKGHIMVRYGLGDEIRFVLKGDDQVYHAAIMSIQEFSFVTMQRDTIRFLDVAKLKFRNKGTMKYVKSTLIGSAGLTALHFALKPAFGKKNPQSINGLLYAAGVGVVSSVFVLATSRSHIKLTGFKRLKFINYDSPLYR